MTPATRSMERARAADVNLENSELVRVRVRAFHQYRQGENLKSSIAAPRYDLQHVEDTRSESSMSPSSLAYRGAMRTFLLEHGVLRCLMHIARTRQTMSVSWTLVS